jgi:hypothetical protein
MGNRLTKIYTRTGDDGTKNSNNNTQDVDTESSQEVSWADEAGVYTADVVHTASQTLRAAE